MGPRTARLRGRLSIIEYAPAVEGKVRSETAGKRRDARAPFHDRDRDDGPETGELAPGRRRPRRARHLQHGLGHDRIETRRRARRDTPNEQTADRRSRNRGIDFRVCQGARSAGRAKRQRREHGREGGPVAADTGNKGSVTITMGGKTWTHDVASHLQKDTPLEGSAFTMRLEGYWPDFRITDGKPASVSEEPNNAAVVVTLRGRGVPGGRRAGGTRGCNGGHDAGESPHALPRRRWEHELRTRLAKGRTLERASSHWTRRLSTGWADWQLVVDRILPHAEQWMEFNPVAAAPRLANMPDGVLVRVAARCGDAGAMGAGGLADRGSDVARAHSSGVRLETGAAADRDSSCSTLKCNATKAATVPPASRARCA